MPSRYYINSVKQSYPKGTRIVIDYMEDPRPVEPGTHGTVNFVDDIGVIHVLWDNGRTLGIVSDIDEFHLEEEE